MGFVDGKQADALRQRYQHFFTKFLISKSLRRDEQDIDSIRENPALDFAPILNDVLD